MLRQNEQVSEKGIRVVLADDHHAILNSITNLLESSPGIKVIGTAENGRRAIELVRSESPDVLVLDIDMPEMNGLQALTRLRSLGLEVKTIILSIYAERSIVRTAFQLGAAGYVLKHDAAGDMVKAVRQVERGESFLSAALAGAL